MFARLRSFAVQWFNTLRHRCDLVDVTNVIGGDRRIGRVRAWGCTGRRYVVGDAVPHLRNRSTYSVLTEEGWFVNVTQGVIDSWSKRPVHDSVADLYGRLRVPPARRRR